VLEKEVVGGNLTPRSHDVEAEKQGVSAVV
jgi:hypothetical protein